MLMRTFIAVVCVVFVSSCVGHDNAMITARVESIRQGDPPRACVRTKDPLVEKKFGCYRFSQDDVHLLVPGNCVDLRVPSGADPDPEFADRPLSDISLADSSRCKRG